MVQTRCPPCQSKSESWPFTTAEDGNNGGGEHSPFFLAIGTACIKEVLSSGHDEHDEQEQEDDIVRELLDTAGGGCLDRRCLHLDMFFLRPPPPPPLLEREDEW